MRRLLMASLALLGGLLLGHTASAQFTTGGTGSTGTTLGGTNSLGGSSGITQGGGTGGTSFGGGQGGNSFGGSGLGSGGQGSQGIGSGSFTDSSLLGQSMNQTTTNANSYGGTSLLGKNYVYPLAKGIPTQNILGNSTGTSNTAFGQALFTVPAAGSTTTGARGATGTRMGQTGQGTASTTLGQGTFASSAGVDRVVPYVTELGFQPNLASPTVVGQQVQASLANSTRLSNQGVQVVAEPNGIVLRGQAQNDRERLVIEAMARLQPGVRAIRNEITVPGR